ncbi:Arm DNA-binding domain-containing protein [Aeromonas bestiarum]|uniref:Arm DNA-binding domain-containing protein n=1 Tax=Aeromonas bestiarum TaxID=105751 RepID=UPI0033906C37
MLRGHDDDTPRKVADRDGLSVLWRNSGKVSFVYRYRILGKAKNLTLGSYTGQEGGGAVAFRGKEKGGAMSSLVGRGQ